MQDKTAFLREAREAWMREQTSPVSIGEVTAFDAGWFAAHRASAPPAGAPDARSLWSLIEHLMECPSCYVKPCDEWNNEVEAVDKRARAAAPSSGEPERWCNRCGSRDICTPRAAAPSSAAAEPTCICSPHIAASALRNFGRTDCPVSEHGAGAAEPVQDDALADELDALGMHHSARGDEARMRTCFAAAARLRTVPAAPSEAPND